MKPCETYTECGDTEKKKPMLYMNERHVMNIFFEPDVQNCFSNYFVVHLVGCTKSLGSLGRVTYPSGIPTRNREYVIIKRVKRLIIVIGVTD